MSNAQEHPWIVGLINKDDEFHFSVYFTYTKTKEDAGTEALANPGCGGCPVSGLKKTSWKVVFVTPVLEDDGPAGGARSFAEYAKREGYKLRIET